MQSSNFQYEGFPTNFSPDVLQIYSSSSVKRAPTELRQMHAIFVQMGHGLRTEKQHAKLVLPAHSPPLIYPVKTVAQEAFPERKHLLVRSVQRGDMPIILTTDANPALWTPFHRHQWIHAFLVL